MASEYGNRKHHIRVVPSALAELNTVIHQLDRKGDASGHFHTGRKHIETQRPDLMQRVRSLWPETHKLLPRGFELIVPAAHFGYLPGDDPEPFFARFGELVAKIIDGMKTLETAGDPTPDVAAARVERFQALLDPVVQGEYVGLLRDVWNELAPMWERDGLPIVHLECSRIRQRLDEGADLLELLPPKHFLQFDEYAARVRRALDQHEPIVVTPLHFASGGYTVDLETEGTALFLGYSPRSEGIHQATLQKATDVATRLKAFSDPTRLTVLATIGELDVTVGDLAKLLDITQPSVSGHLKVLQEAGLVTVRKKGVKSFYRANAEAIEALIKEAHDLLI